MILFRTSHPDYPFHWHDDDQPAARWHEDGSGPVHYFATTADGAWAELLRHEEITDPEDLKGLDNRAIWVIELEPSDLERPNLDEGVLIGGLDTYEACQKEARRLRTCGFTGIRAPSAAISPDGAALYSVNSGQQIEPIPSEVVVLFGFRPDVKAQLASIGGRPHPRILKFVRHF